MADGDGTPHIRRTSTGDELGTAAEAGVRLRLRPANSAGGRVIASIEDPAVIRKILQYLESPRTADRVEAAVAEAASGVAGVYAEQSASMSASLVPEPSYAQRLNFRLFTFHLVRYRRS